MNQIDKFKKPVIKKEIKKEISNHNEIEKLKRELEVEKKKNKQLQDTINQLKQNHNIEIEKYKKDINKLVEKNKELEKLLEEKTKKLMIIYLNLVIQIIMNN